MIAWQTIDSGDPYGSDEESLSLHRRGDEWSIRVRGVELMNSRRHGSERALADRAAEAIRAGDVRRVLVGGLGMGFTQAAALACFPHATVVVAEISPRVVAWNREVLADLAGRPLEDPRSRVVTEDVVVPLRAAAEAADAERFDAVLLDLDNGPESLTRDHNAFLYSREGLDLIAAALAQGGVLGVWSAGPEPGFERRMRAAGWRVARHRVPASGTGRGGRRHVVWIARRGSATLSPHR